MSKRLRIRKSGQRVYEIRVSRGYDPLTGKQRKPYQMTWRVPDTYSDKVAEREACKVEGKFIADCKAGKILTKEEKKQHLLEEAEKAKRDRLERESKPSYSEYVESYLESREKAGLAPTTISGYRKVLNAAKNQFGDMKMEDITRSMMREYMQKIFNDKGFMYNTKIRYHAIMQTLFKTAVEEEVIEESPMRNIKRPRKPKDEKAAEDEVKALSEKQLSEVFAYLELEPLKWKMMVYFMVDTGCRRGEVCGLKWEHINLNTGEITICNNRQYINKEIGIIDTSTKSGKTRTVFLTENMLKMMKDWKKKQALDLFKNGLPQATYCFPGKGSEGLNPNCVTRYFHDFGKKYGFENFHPHMLRHTMATLMIANGADVVTVSKKLGHSNVALTLNVYSHANEEAQKRANNILENALYGQDSKQA